MKLNNFVTEPLITEKTMADAQKGKFTFKVNADAAKGAIAHEISSIFDVKVLAVKTSVLPSKKRRIGKTNRFTKTMSWKKAVVSLKEGQKIDLFEKK